MLINILFGSLGLLLMVLTLITWRIQRNKRLKDDLSRENILNEIHIAYEDLEEQRISCIIKSQFYPELKQENDKKIQILEQQQRNLKQYEHNLKVGTASPKDNPLQNQSPFQKLVTQS